MLETQLKQFRNPGAEFRGAPFWAWNAKLEIPELQHQIRLMKEMGFGGFFMHSRVGLNTKYLGKTWFDCVRACVDEAEKHGMNAWLYDEDRWPSGAAGGKVTKDDRCKMKGLYCECAKTFAEAGADGNHLAWFIAEADTEKRKVYRSRRIACPGQEALSENEVLLRFFWKNNECSSWFNGETYLDTLSEEAVGKFVETTHEHYRREIGEQFGKTIPGIFTDEPCYSHFAPEALPWTFNIPGEFRKTYGYDLLDFLPELFYRTEEEVSHTRWAYYNLVTAMFVRAFSGTIGNWCGENKLNLTGHVLAEDSLTSQTACSGAVMRFYEYMQIPGIDLLTEHWNIFGTTKQCVSAARQFGKKVRLSEIYGCAGWDFPFAGHKALGDWQYALGINFRCQHLAWYSMSGEAKRDFPASISCQSPWFRKYKFVEDYFARLGSILTGGEEIRDLLVLHPIESYWSISLRFPEIIPENRPEMDQKFEWLTNELISENLDFDYGDEEIMSRLGSAENGILKIGNAVYRSVLLPELKTIRSSTLKLLKQFVQCGGQVCFFGKAPVYVDALRSTEAEAVFQEYFIRVGQYHFIERLSHRARRVSMTGPAGNEVRPLLFHFAENDDFHSLFICNFGKEFAGDMMKEDQVRERNQAFPEVEISVKSGKLEYVYEMNPENGEIYTIDSSYENGVCRFKTSFEPRASRLFLLSNTVLPDVLPQRDVPVLQKFADLPSGNWKFCLAEPNVLVLDHADYSINGEEKGNNGFILQIDDELRTLLGSGLRGEAMIQPWLRDQSAPACSAHLKLIYHFACEKVPGQCSLVLENPELYQVRINDTVLDLSQSDWWIDKALRSVPLPDHLLRAGDNIIEMTCNYAVNQPGLENIYLLGDFGVRNDVITTMPSTLSSGDWCKQGLPYYAGNLTYEMMLDQLPEGRTFLSIPEWRGAVLGISVNENQEKIIAWPPERMELTPFLKKDGRDRLRITVYNHRRNAFGPFYLQNKWPIWTGTKEFKRCEVPEKQTVSMGLLQTPVLETTVNKKVF